MQALIAGKLHMRCLHDSTQEPEIQENPCAEPGHSGYQCPPNYTCHDGWEGPNFGITNFDNIGLAMLTVFICVTNEGWTGVRTIAALFPLQVFHELTFSA